MQTHTQAARPSKQPPPIVRRKMRFAFGDVDERFWFRNNGAMTAMLSAMSTMFPPGEREFVRSVFHYKDRLDGELLKQVRDFASQEGMHAHQHTRANDWLDQMGFGTKAIEDVIEEEIRKFVEEDSPAVHLAATVGAEHLTALMAAHALEHPEFSEGMPESVRELLQWHAAEEIEHKAVAFDVYQEVEGDPVLLRWVFVLQTIMFAWTTRRIARQMLENLGHSPTLKARLELVDYLLGKGGLVPSIAGRWLSFLKPGFHPWDHDDSHLIDEWRKRAGREGELGRAAAAA